ncbi:winged helix-turn-helix domain-containing protein [Plasticicumulans sp.]|uniref:winged helix-turn-helix domain-containing protein n=1 Tax=Plasticicumulans sp. TaxID=2307179 RepID=UPI0039648836
MIWCPGHGTAHPGSGGCASSGQAGLPYALWTRRTVQALVLREASLEVPIRTVSGEYLRRWGYTPP